MNSEEAVENGSETEACDLSSLVRAEQTLLRLRSRPHWIEPTVEFLRQKAVLCGACHESRSRKLLISLQEALVNAVVHGNLELSSDLKQRDDNSFAEALARQAADPQLSARMVDVLVEYNGNRCRWIITDQGKGFDYAAVMQRLENAEPDVVMASGRGILLMKSFLDDVRYEDSGRRLILTMNRASGEEKRQHARVDETGPVRIAPIRADGSVDWDAAYEAVSLNYSEKGIGLLQQQLATSERIIIGIYSGGQPVYIPAEVRHCRSVSGDIVELGCRFQSRAEAEEVRGLPSQADALEAVHRAVDEFLEKHKGPPVGSDERRAHPRLAYTARIEITRYVVGGDSAEPAVAFARDLSKGGIAFISTMSLPPDIVVALPQEHSPALRIRGRTVRCNKIKDGFFDVGARFVQLM